MAVTYTDLKRKTSGPPHGGKGGPPKPGERPPWVPQIEGSVALMFNTCDDIDGPFIKCMADQMGLPAWGVGPLLPEQYWKSSNASASMLYGEVRGQKRKSNFTEEEVIQWLDTKPHGSVLFVAFGSEVGPSAEEYPQLASALEESTRAFIWVIQPGSEGYVPHGFGNNNRVGSRGLLIYGWAPQLLIRSHKSTGGFLSHCGWNSTMEAIGRGVSFLAWPIRGDQYFNAKLVVSHLRVGYKVTDDSSQMVNKADLLEGIERLMGDDEMKIRAQVPNFGKVFQGLQRLL